LRTVCKNGHCLKRLPKQSAGADSPQGFHLKCIFKMPKVKTNSSAKKRFKVTATGKITHQKSFKRHILTKKSKKRKRALAKDGVVAKANLDFVKRLLRLK
jgi:large subunit ribosomal protein L35